ncbi:hypothetical protein HY638_04375 [Candidatus Woesearchaeota archaeon]|nr:hypothetical protein [Candidatus Woesearchaeota archaeon]
MYLPLLVWIILIVLGVILIFSFIHSIFRAFLTLFTFVLLATVVVALVTGIRVYGDFQDLSRDVENSSTLYVLSIDDKIVAGFEKDKDKISPLDEKALGTYNVPNPALNSRQFVITEQALDNLAPESVSFGGKTLGYAEAKELLKSDSPYKSQLFVLLLGSSENGLSFFMEINSGNILAYPKSPSIDFIEKMPASFARKQLANLREKITEKAVSYGKGV